MEVINRQLLLLFLHIKLSILLFKKNREKRTSPPMFGVVYNFVIFYDWKKSKYLNYVTFFN